jgi:hypothetical protein
MSQSEKATMESDNSKKILGAVEEITFRSASGERKVLARIDTGANMSSIDEKLAAELGFVQVRTKKIRSSHGRSERPVINAEVVVGGIKHISEFTVIDRAHMKYPVLIGRNILENGFLIDPSRK